MKSIQKGREPNSLIEYRAGQTQPYSKNVFDYFAHKDELRESLLQEQGYLCCYCMRRIAASTMKIEHWASQSQYRESALSYDNLLGACYGGEGKPFAAQHCDTHKGNTPLTLNPVQVGDCERLIRYTASGEILSDVPQIDTDLNETLNLNLGWLKMNRAAIVRAVIEGLKRKQPKGTWTRPLIEKEINRWRTLKNGKYREYCQVAIYILEKRVA
jgi:uncharacterized protein (TIGR02646 family)